MKISLTVVLLLTATAAHAQIDATQEIGSRIYTEPRNSTDAVQVSRYSKLVARCAYQRVGPQAVDRMLRASDPRTLATTGDGIQLRRLRNTLGECMTDRFVDYNADVRMSHLAMTVSDTRMRALFLEEAYLAQNPAPPVVTENISEVTNRIYVSSGDELVAARGVGAFADCIVHRNAVGADAVLRTEPGSSEERSAARALAPVLSECLINGQEIGFSAGSIRAMAADGLWSRVFLGSQQLAER